LQAALASAASFTVGAIIPLLTVIVVNQAIMAAFVGGISLTILALLGGLAAYVGGARVIVGALRVLLWGALAMSLTVAAGTLVGSHI
jgi:VIT1/CCC1 family predicted Fe2+/Mn2+ transporter